MGMRQGRGGRSWRKSQWRQSWKLIVVAAVVGIGRGMVVVVIKVSMVVVMELRWYLCHWGRATNRGTQSHMK